MPSGLGMVLRVFLGVYGAIFFVFLRGLPLSFLNKNVSSASSIYIAILSGMVIEKGWGKLKQFELISFCRVSDHVWFDVSIVL